MAHGPRHINLVDCRLWSKGRILRIVPCYFFTHWDLLPFNLEALTKNSAAVIVGRFTKKLDARIPDGKVIFTDYEVAVEEFVKGISNKAKRSSSRFPAAVFFSKTAPVLNKPRQRLNTLLLAAHMLCS